MHNSKSDINRCYLKSVALERLLIRSPGASFYVRNGFDKNPYPWVKYNATFGTQNSSEPLVYKMMNSTKDCLDWCDGVKKCVSVVYQRNGTYGSGRCELRWTGLEGYAIDTNYDTYVRNETALIAPIKPRSNHSSGYT